MTEQAEELSRGEALARVAVLEAELAELRKRVCVPEGDVVVPSVVVEFLKGAGQLEGLWFGQSSIDRGAFWWRKYLFAISAAPAPVERCDTCYGHGEVPTGETQRFGDLQPPEPIMMACPECDGQAPVELLATDGGRNQRFEGLFEGETPDQRDARLASAAPAERVELMTWAQAVDRAARLIDEEQERLTDEGHLMDSVDCCNVLRESADSPQPAPAAAQDVAGLVDFAVRSWHEQVANRPLQNVYRRTLDSVWRQVIRFAGEDDVVLIGPRHDDMLDESGNPLPQYAAHQSGGAK